MDMNEEVHIKEIGELLPGLRRVKGWEEVDSADVKLQRLSNAFTNFVFRCEWRGAKEGTSRIVLGRLYGDSGGLFERELEVVRFNHVNRTGLGPNGLAFFGSGRIEEFYEGWTAVSVEELRSNRIFLNVASRLGEFHCKMLDFYSSNAKEAQKAGEIMLWDTLEEWFGVACNVNMPLVEKLGLSDLAKQLIALKSRFSQGLSKLTCFCHNDLQHGNILMCRDESVSEVKLIDFEYSGFNPVAFDIANHWCELMFNPECEPCIEREEFPGEGQRQAFLLKYIQGVAKAADDLGISRLSNPVDCKEMDGKDAKGNVHQYLMSLLDLVESPDGVAALHKQALEFVPISDLLWGVWGVIQDAQSEIDFDFQDYAARRIEAYHRACSFDG